MCYGPVQVIWNEEQRGRQPEFDDKLLLLAAFDLIEIDTQKAYNAAPNEYDFYFMARERIDARNAQLSIFFPFPTTPLPMRVRINDPQRRDHYLGWQMHFFDQTVRTQDKSHPHSFGWDAAETVRLLPPVPGKQLDAAGLLQHHLQRALTADFALNEGGITIEMVPYDGDTLAGENYQRFVVTLNGRLEAGDFFHISFQADEAAGEPIPGAPCAGEALLYHYDRRFGELELSQQKDRFHHAPIVPCTLLQVVIMFPQKAQVRPRSYAKTTLHGPRSLTSPTGRSFPDWRWFVICNAHIGFSRRKFMTWWDLEDCPDRQAARPKTLTELLGDELLDLVSEGERPWITDALQTVHELTPQEMKVALRMSQAHTNDRIAAELYLTTKTVEKHVTRIYRKLGFDALQEDGARLRKVVLLTKVMILQQLM